MLSKKEDDELLNKCCVKNDNFQNQLYKELIYRHSQNQKAT